MDRPAAPAAWRRLLWPAITATFLLVPFVLRHLSNALEPYPAVLLPVGSGTMDLDGGPTTVVHHGLEAMLAGGGRMKVDPRALLGRAAGAQWPRLAATAFNTRPTPRMPVRGRELPPWPAATAEEQDALRTWLRQRTEVLGLGPVESLLIIRHERTFDRRSGAELQHASYVTDTLHLGR